MKKQDKVQKKLWLNAGTAQYLTGLCEDLGIVNTMGRHAGSPSLSELLEGLSRALHAGDVNPCKLAKSCEEA